MTDIDVSKYQMFMSTSIDHIDTWVRAINSGKHPIFADINIGAFLWRTSPEGEDYWKRVYCGPLTDGEKEHSLNVLNQLRYALLLGTAVREGL